MKVSLLLSLVVVSLFLVSFPAPAAADEIVPMYPCRLLDTRNTAVGYLPPGSVLNFAVRAAPTSPAPAQGGQAGCSVPYNATGAVLHLIAIQPSGNGHALMWPYGTPQPVASVLNVTVLQTESTATVALLGANGPAMDVSLRNIGFLTYWVVDLVAYTVPSTATLVGQAVGTLFGGTVLVIETVDGNTVKVFASDAHAGFKVSWLASLPDALDRCVHIDGKWLHGSSTIEYDTVEAKGLPIVVDGYCGPDVEAACQIQHTFDLRYSATTSRLFVPSTSTTNLAVHGPAGNLVTLGSQASQPGTYVIKEVDPAGKYLVVDPRPQTATDQALDVSITSGSC